MSLTDIVTRIRQLTQDNILVLYTKEAVKAASILLPIWLWTEVQSFLWSNSNADAQ